MYHIFANEQEVSDARDIDSIIKDFVLRKSRRIKIQPKMKDLF